MRKYYTKLLLFIFTLFILSGASLTARAEESTSTYDYSLVYNSEYYYTNNIDLQTTIGTDTSTLLSHFVTSGMLEGRQGSDNFNVSIYMQNYPDLVKILGYGNLSSYYYHYMSSGYAEGRIASYLLDETNTITTNNSTIVPENSDSTTVYITKSGSKYHQGWCSYLSHSKISISKQSAISQDYTPCSRCNP